MSDAFPNRANPHMRKIAITAHSDTPFVNEDRRRQVKKRNGKIEITGALYRITDIAHDIDFSRPCILEKIFPRFGYELERQLLVRAYRVEQINRETMRGIH